MMNKAYVNYLKGDKKSDRTITEYVKYVNQMLDFIGKPDIEITYSDLVNWKASISHLSASTICIQIAAIKSYFQFLEDAELINRSPADKLKRPTKKNKEKLYPEAWMVRGMIDYARTIRDKAIIMLFATTGIRVSELTELTVEQYQNMKGENNREIKITGKGSKERTIYINDDVKELIDMYLKSRPKTSCNKLFLSFQGGEIHSNNLSQTLKNTAKKAGIPFWNEVSNHWLRAAFATMQSEAGTPVATIQAALGHSSLSTTSVYIKHSQNEINKTMRNIVF